MLNVAIFILCCYIPYAASTNLSGAGTAASAVGNGYAWSSDGRRVSVANGVNGPNVASSGGGMATAFDGRRIVSSVNGVQNPDHFVSTTQQFEKLKKLKPKKGRKMGSFAYAGAGFNPFQMVGLSDPRLMLQRH